MLPAPLPARCVQVQQHPPGDAFRAAMARDLSLALLSQVPLGAVLSVQATVVEGCVQFLALTRALLPGGPAAAGGLGAAAELAEALRASLPPGVERGEARVCIVEGGGAGDAAGASSASSSGGGAAGGQVRALSAADLQVSYIWPPCLACGLPGGQAQLEVVLELKAGPPLAGGGGGIPPRAGAVGQLPEGRLGVRLVVVQAGAAVADVQVALPAEDLRVRWAARLGAWQMACCLPRYLLCYLP
jgi:hypothetical protein